MYLYLERKGDKNVLLGEKGHKKICGSGGDMKSTVETQRYDGRKGMKVNNETALQFCLARAFPET